MAGRLLNTELKEFDATTLDGTYKIFGSVLSNPATKVQFLNTSDVDIYVSIDGATNKFRIPAGASITFDESTAPVPNKGSEYYLEQGTQLYVTQVSGAGTDGDLIGHIITRVLTISGQ